MEVNDMHTELDVLLLTARILFTLLSVGIYYVANSRQAAKETISFPQKFFYKCN